MNLSTPTKTLDVLGQTCPYPGLKTGAALRKLEVGEILEVLVDFEMSVKSGLPKFCEKHGCKYECIKENSGGKVFWKFYIEKSGSKTLNIGKK
jgi:TusA-related sulfurtransferase